MIVTVMGEARAEYCNVPKKNKEKRFFLTRQQLYWTPPNGFARVRIDYFGEIKEDEIIVYPEDDYIPYQIKSGMSYTMDGLLEEIDIHKGLTDGGWFNRHKHWFTNNNTGIDLMKLIKNPVTWGVILAIILVGPAILRTIFR